MRKKAHLADKIYVFLILTGEQAGFIQWKDVSAGCYPTSEQQGPNRLSVGKLMLYNTYQTPINKVKPPKL